METLKEKGENWWVQSEVKIPHLFDVGDRERRGGQDTNWVAAESVCGKIELHFGTLGEVDDLGFRGRLMLVQILSMILLRQGRLLCITLY